MFAPIWATVVKCKLNSGNLNDFFEPFTSPLYSPSTTVSPAFCTSAKIDKLPKMGLDINKYTEQIRDILQAPGVDLSTISAKRVRKQLLEQNGDLSPEFVKEHKEEIDTLIGVVYEQVSGEGGAEDDEDSKRKYENGEDSADGAPSTKKSKKSSQKTDEELARQLSKELNGRERNARTAAPKSGKAATKRGKKGAKSSATVDSDGEGSVDPDAKPKRKGGFTKEYLLR